MTNAANEHMKGRALLRSRLCWRVALTVFVSILVVEAAVLIPSYRNYERDLLARLREIGLSTLSSVVHISASSGQRNPLIADVMIASAPKIRGAAIYDPDDGMIGVIGEPPDLTPDVVEITGDRKLRTRDDSRYDVMWTGDQTGLPFIVIGRLDASWIAPELAEYAWYASAMALLLAVFVAGVTILVLGRQILQPMLDLRAKLVAAWQDPTNADRYMLERRRSDELGDMIDALNELLRRLSHTHRSVLEESRQRFRAIVENSPAAISLKGADGRYFLVNQQFEKLANVPGSEIIGKTSAEIFAEEFAKSGIEHDSEVLASGQPSTREERLHTADGIRTFLTVKFPIHDAKGDVVAIGGIHTDITERIRAEAERRASEERFRTVVDHSPTKIHIKDLDGRYLLVNREAERLFGVSDEEARGKTTDDIFHEVEAEAFRAHDKAVLETGKAIEEEEVFVLDDGAHTYLTVKFPIRDAFGKPTAIGAIGTDITERKQVEAELRSAKEEAEIANRTKSEFLANMSHELRTPLNAILGFSEIIRDHTFGPVGNPKYVEYANDIHSSGAHLLQLINDILDLSKIEAGKSEIFEEDVDVARVIDNCMVLVRERALGGDVRLESDVPPGLPLLTVDKRMFKQMVLNLLSNAVKFTPPGGSVTLRATADERTGFTIAVEDTGIGIAAEDIPKAMSQFDQVDGNLDRKYEGTGLGLPLTKALAELHGGSLTLESEVGKGTVAILRFPPQRIARGGAAVASG